MRCLWLVVAAAVIAAAAAQADSPELDPVHMQATMGLNLISAQEAYSEGLDAFRTIVASPQTAAERDQVAERQVSSSSWLGHYLIKSANFLDLGDGTYRGPLRMALGYLTRMLARSIDTPQYTRPPHSYYHTPRDAMWPDWDVKGDHLNGWENAMWGGALGALHPVEQESLTDFVLKKLGGALGIDDEPAPEVPPEDADASAARARAVALLERAVSFYPPPRTPEEVLSATLGNRTFPQVTHDALWVLGEHFFWGTHGAQADLQRAQGYFESLAALGNATAHGRLGFIQSSALTAHNATDAQIARAVSHYTFGAHLGDRHSQLALAFRYATGLGVSPSCNDSYAFSEAQARTAYAGSLDYYYDRMPTYSKVSLASLARHPPAELAGPRGKTRAVKKLLRSDPRALTDTKALQNHLEITWYDAERGDLRAQVQLAVMLYEGSVLGASQRLGAVKRDMDLSYKLAMDAVERVFYVDMPASLERQRTNDSSFALKQHIKTEKDVRMAGFAAELLATMIMRGHAARPLEEAGVYLAIAMQSCGTECINARVKKAFLHRYGTLTYPANKTRAVELLNHTSSAEAYVNVALIMMEDGNMTPIEPLLATALQYEQFPVRTTMLESKFTTHFLLGLYYGTTGEFTSERCAVATHSLLQASLRGDWEDPIYHRAEAAWAHGDTDTALRAWAISAESGERSAQESIAYVLDPQRTLLRGVEHPDTAAVAREYWSRAAMLDSGAGLVRLGDYYYEGIGSEKDVKTAMDLYNRVPLASLDFSEAMYALGWIYETGNGLHRRDLNMAKRYYDNAMVMSSGRAYLAVSLALVRVHVRAVVALLHGDASAWNLFSSYAEHILQFVRRGTSVYEEPSESLKAPKVSKQNAAAAHRQSATTFRVRVMGIDAMLFVAGVLAVIVLYAIRTRVARDLHRAEARLHEARAVR